MQRTSSPRTKRLIARLSEAEFQAYLELVKHLATTRSRMIRGMIREALGMGPDLLAQDMRTLKEGVYQLGALGRNLNQQLKAMHTGQLAGRAVDKLLMEQLRDQVKNLEGAWLMAIKNSKNRWISPPDRQVQDAA